VDRRINPHRGFVGIFVRDIQVHVEQVAVSFPNSALSEPANRVGEIKINSQTARPNAAPSSQTSFALRDAISRGTRFPKLGFFRSKRYFSSVARCRNGHEESWVAREISGYGQYDAKVRRLIPSIF